MLFTCPPKVAGLKGSNPRCRKTPGGGGLLIVFLLNIRLQFCTIVIIASEHSWDTLLFKKKKKRFNNKEILFTLKIFKTKIMKPTQHILANKQALLSAFLVGVDLLSVL